MQLVDDVDEPVAREVRERERLMRQLLAFRGGARRARPCTGRCTAGAAHARTRARSAFIVAVGEAAGPLRLSCCSRRSRWVPRAVFLPAVP